MHFSECKPKNKTEEAWELGLAGLCDEHRSSSVQDVRDREGEVNLQLSVGWLS